MDDGMDTVEQPLPMVTIITVNIALINVTVVVDTNGTMVVSTMACFGKTNDTAGASLPGPTELSTKVISAMDNGKDMEPIDSVMEDDTKEVGKMAGTMALGFAIGKMDDVTRVNG